MEQSLTKETNIHIGVWLKTIGLCQKDVEEITIFYIQCTNDRKQHFSMFKDKDSDV